MEIPKIVFFGTPDFSVKILEAMEKAGYAPAAVVTAPDKPRGRKMTITPPPVKTWAEKHGIKVFQPEKIKDLGIKIYDSGIESELFVLASYGKILPKEILDIPKHGMLNVHPSLLPKLRGPSPIQTAILNGEEKTGVTIMLMDEKMDEGPILAQKELGFKIYDLRFKKLEEKLAELGGNLLVETIPKWIAGEIKPAPQDHTKATYTKIITKKDGEIDWKETPEMICRKICAFTPWPGAYTFANGKRVIITEAETRKDALVIKRVKPEGKKEMSYEEYLKGNPPIQQKNQLPRSRW